MAFSDIGVSHTLSDEHITALIPRLSESKLGNQSDTPDSRAYGHFLVIRPDMHKNPSAFFL